LLPELQPRYVTDFVFQTENPVTVWEVAVVQSIKSVAYILLPAVNKSGKAY